MPGPREASPSDLVLRAPKTVLFFGGDHFSLCPSKWIIFNVLKLTDFSAISILLSNPSDEFFISYIIIFFPKIPVVFFMVSLLIISIFPFEGVSFALWGDSSHFREVFVG